MKILSYCLMLVFAVVMVACTGTDTETIVKQTQCHDDTIVTGDETCPEPLVTPSQGTTPSQETTPNNDDEDTNRGADGCFQLPSTNTNYTAGDGDEVICGTEVDNTISGGEGDDTIYGRDGNDTLIGGKHRDTLKGEVGNDTLIGGEDLDILDGGNDTDTVDYSRDGGDEAVTVDLIAGTATDTYGDEDTLISIENVKGTNNGVDDMKGDNGPNIIDGGNNVTDDNAETSDKLDGRGGDDTIVVRANFNLATAQNASAGDPNIKNFENIEGRGTKQTDGTTTYIALVLTGDNKANTITGADGGTVADTINGAGGNDTLKGRRGGDNLNGDSGNDNLYGGLGDDTLDGGVGNDDLYGNEGGDCFIIDISSFSADGTVPSDSSSDSNNSGRKDIIKATKDTIKNYEDGDKIAINGATGSSPVVAGTNTSKDATILVGNVIVSKGKIDIVTQQYREASDNNTPDDRTDDIKLNSQDKETLVTVAGLTETRFNSVSIDATCPAD